MGWNTVAIIPELRAEIKKANSKKYKEGLAELFALEKMLNEVQGNSQSQDIITLVDEWKRRRNDLR